MTQQPVISKEAYDLQLTYLTTRTIRLLNMIKRDWFEKYFTIEFEGKQFNFMERLTILIKTTLLYEELLFDILPHIKRRLNFSARRIEEEHKNLRGAINWGRTLKNYWQRPETSTPTRFVSKIPFKQFEKTENVLTVLTILELQLDCFNLLTRYILKERLVSEERELLTRIICGCNKILRTPCFRGLQEKAKKYLRLEGNDPGLLRLEKEAENNIKSSIRTNRGYIKLLDWRERYKKLDIRSSIDKKNLPSIKGRVDINKMYELWILLEMVHYLRHMKKTRVRIVDFPHEFATIFDDRELLIYYQRRADIISPGWAIGGLPDFVIKYGKSDNEGVILDAKNYGASSKTIAIYKMLGYLNNFNMKHGILFFPEKKTEGPSFDIRPDQTYQTGQIVSWITLHPSDKKEFVESKKQNFEALFNYVVNIKE